MTISGDRLLVKGSETAVKLVHAYLMVSSLLLTGCDRVLGEAAGKIGEAEVIAGSGAGGLLRFSGVMAGIAFDAAQKHCWQFQ